MRWLREDVELLVGQPGAGRGASAAAAAGSRRRRRRGGRRSRRPCRAPASAARHPGSTPGRVRCPDREPAPRAVGAPDRALQPRAEVEVGLRDPQVAQDRVVDGDDCGDPCGVERLGDHVLILAFGSAAVVNRVARWCLVVYGVGWLVVPGFFAVVIRLQVPNPGELLRDVADHRALWIGANVLLIVLQVPLIVAGPALARSVRRRGGRRRASGSRGRRGGRPDRQRRVPRRARRPPRRRGHDRPAGPRPRPRARPSCTRSATPPGSSASARWR